MTGCVLVILGQSSYGLLSVGGPAVAPGRAMGRIYGVLCID